MFANQYPQRRGLGLLFFVSFFLSGEGWSAPAPAAFSPLKMFVKTGDRIEIKGFRGSVEYVVNEAAQDVSVEVRQSNSTAPLKYQEEWQFSFKRDGSSIQANVEGPTSKQIWNEVLISGVLPEFHLRLTGPSLPLAINWNEGRITVANLNSELQITAIKGFVVVTKGEGPLALTTQEGNVIIRDRKGEVKIDSYIAKVEVKNIEGKLDLQNFTGETQIEDISGEVNLSSFKGTSKVAGLKGRLEFKNGNSPLHIEKFEGELRGRSAQGSVYAEVRGDADVRVESAEGAVNLRLPASGAWVNLGTAEGSLVVPGFLKLTRLPAQQIRTGRLRGTNGGSIFVRTTSGDIRIK